ncbi:MAG: YraN family protein [Rectinemataceae bacterium]
MKGRLGKDSSAAAGRRGEEAAAERLESENWLVLARNYRAGPGEIDIVAAKDGILCFVEVKSWERLGSEQLADSINAAKRRRILETAKIFLARHREYSSWRIRFDVLLLRGGSVVEHYESAFTGEL